MNMLEATRAFLLKLWKDQDIQIMILISLMAQLFLLFTGNLRRRRIRGLLRFMIWLAYIGADAVAVFTIGLLSKYEDKYKLRRRQLTEEHTLPFLWGPFLLLHLGGQDTITAFSMEDNNLWLRHLLNLVVQVTLTLYVFWKTFDILDSQLLAVAAPIYVAGLIKYGERTWTLYSGCREYLSSCNEEAEESQRSTSCGDVVASYALNTVLWVRGLFVGRTLFHLRPGIEDELVDGFQETMQQEGSLKIVMAELDMMYDLLYTKAMVLQSRRGRLFRCIADTSMVVAFVLFQANHELHRYNRDDLIITYTLFAGALFMEAYSISMVIVSPWTRASLKTGSFLLRLSCSACSVFNAIGRCTKRMARWRRQQQQEQEMSSFSMGQFNLTDYSMSQNCRPKLISKAVSLFGFEKHVKDKGIIAYVGNLFSLGQGSQDLYLSSELQERNLGRALLYVLNMPFEHALFRLHIYTHLYLSRIQIELQEGEMALVAAECMKLANYLMHLMVVCPYMLPVGRAAQDLEPTFTKWVRDNWDATRSTKRQILERYTAARLDNPNEPFSVSPFDSLPPSVGLRTIKETWARLLIYAAAKCPMEMHARQLSNGVEPITFLSFLMLHHAEGDAGKREVSLFIDPSSDPYPAQEGRLVSMYDASWRPRPHRPRYAFEFREHDALQPAEVPASLFVAAWETPSVEIRPRWFQMGRVRILAMEQAASSFFETQEQPPQLASQPPAFEEAYAQLHEDYLEEVQQYRRRQEEWTAYQEAVNEWVFHFSESGERLLRPERPIEPLGILPVFSSREQFRATYYIGTPASEIGQFDDAAINTPEAGYMTPEIEHISRRAIAQDPTSIARVFGWVPSAIAFFFSASIARLFGWVPSAIAFFFSKN